MQIKDFRIKYKEKKNILKNDWTKLEQKATKSFAINKTKAPRHYLELYRITDTPEKMQFTYHSYDLGLSCYAFT